MNKTLTGNKIGFVGLGHMGWPMARHLQDAGAEMVVWNRSEERAREAESRRMVRASSLPELARSVAGGVICLNLTHTAVVREVVFGPGGLVEGLDPRSLIIDFGTTGVAETREFSSRASWLDVPVSGGQVGAENATLTLMAGGSAEDFQRALPLLQVLGKRVTHLGASGAGQVTKLANQLIVAQTIDAVAQALRLAELSGLDSARVREALMGGFADSRILELHGQRMVRREFAPGGRATLQLKDVRLICELAATVGLRSPTLENCLRQWETFVEERGFGELDHSGLFRLYE